MGSESERQAAEESLDRNSTLPFFERSWIGQFMGDDLVSYTCSRADCGKTFYVDESIDRSTTGCPHCGRWGRLPS